MRSNNATRNRIQPVERYTRFSLLSFLLFALGCGHSGYRSRFEGPQHFKMPELRGASAEQAEKQLRKAGKLGMVDWREEDCGHGAATGAICCTYPWAGAEVMKSESIVLYVQAPRATTAVPRRAPGSAGAAAPAVAGAPPLTHAPMPDVVGQRLDVARATLAAAGFSRLIVQYLEHDGCAADIVCGVGPRPGATGHHALAKILYVGKQPPAPPPLPPAPPPLKAPRAPRPPASFF